MVPVLHSPVPSLEEHWTTQQIFGIEEELRKQQTRDLAALQIEPDNLERRGTLWPAALSERGTRELEGRGTGGPAGDEEEQSVKTGAA